VQVRGIGWSSPRGIDDIRIKREVLEASPRQQTSEMLSAAPGFFVDHEDGEGIGNDVYLRGFDLDHGSGIEMRVGNVPINIPNHIQGQGYADANFIIPEVVRSIRVLEGPYDPRQGDTAIVGSAYFDLGVTDRGAQLKTTYGSFNQVRVVGVAAPKGLDDETFAAVALRKTDGFGANRASESGTVNAQYGFDVGARDHVRLLGTAYGVRATLPGVVREDDVDAGRIGFYGSYPFFSEGQGVQTSRVIVGADFDHVAASGARFEFAPWVMWTNFRARENFTGNIYSSEIDPMLAGGMGDLWETTNVETAAGFTSRFHAAPWHLGSWLEATAEPGVNVRFGHTDQTKSLLNPQTLQAWDRRVDDNLDSMDAGAYLDLDVRLWDRLRLSGGLRADLLYVSINDRLGYDLAAAGGASQGALPGSVRDAQGVAAGPRVTAEYDITPEIAPVVSYGEGFRSLDATANVASTNGPPAPGLPLGAGGGGPSVQEGATPYSKVRSVEAGLRAQMLHERYTATLAAFETWVGNELVFEATSGGFTTENASIRRGVTASALAKPVEWLLASLAASVTSATFTTLVEGVSHYVPNVPPVLFRADISARGKIAEIAHRPLNGRVGVGYTFLAGRHLTDTITGPANNVLNANAALRYGFVELGVDAYNVLNLRYADDEERYTSNWTVTPGVDPLATTATHLVAAPPLTVLGTLALYL
jgi:iron complex outermembrane recepter protein